MISTGCNASNHSGLVINLNKKQDYKLIADVTESKLKESKLLNALTPTKFRIKKSCW